MAGNNQIELIMTDRGGRATPSGSGGGATTAAYAPAGAGSSNFATPAGLPSWRGTPNRTGTGNESNAPNSRLGHAAEIAGRVGLRNTERLIGSLDRLSHGVQHLSGRATSPTSAVSGSGSNNPFSSMTGHLGRVASGVRNTPFDSMQGGMGNAARATAETRAAAATAGGGAEAAGSASGIARIAAMAGPIGAVIGGLTVLAGLTYGAARAVKGFYDSLRERGEALSAYSGPLSAAFAVTELRQTMSEIRRASAQGGNLARIERSRGRFEERLYDLVTRIQTLLLDKIAPLLEIVINNLTAMVSTLKVIVDIFTFNRKELQNDFKQMIEDIKRIFNPFGGNDDNLKDPFVEDFMRVPAPKQPKKGK